MGLFGNPKIDGHKLQECLASFEAETRVISFQTREADLYNNTLAMYGNSLAQDGQAADNVRSAVRRLSEAATEALRRHDEIKDVPSDAFKAHYAWHLTLQANEVWALAMVSVVEAMAKGMNPDMAYVQRLVDNYQKAWKNAASEDKRLMGRLKVSSQDMAALISRAQKAGETDSSNWIPEGRGDRS